MCPVPLLRQLAVAGCLAAALFGAAGTAAATADAGAIRLKPVEILDHNGFGGPMVAFRTLVPHDWEPRGGITWQPNVACEALSMRHEWAAVSPDGLSAVEMLPQAGWQMSNMPADPAAGCPALGITSVRQYVEQLVASRRPEARILDYRDRPDRVAALGVEPRHEPMPMGEARLWLEVGEALIGYSHEGRSLREVVQAGVYFVYLRMDSGMPGQVFEHLSGTALPAFALRAPDGTLDFQLAEALNAAFRIDPAYEQQLVAHQQAMNRIAAKGAADRAEISRRSNAEISQIIADGHANRQAMQDRTNAAFSRAIRDVELYADPVSGPIELPSHYERAWRLDNGEYLLSNDHQLDPYADLGLSGTPMERTR